MANTCLVGAQWGDEGKGRISDFLAQFADVVVRYQGGANAGHTVVTGGKTYKFALIPSGILYSGTLCILGPGMVIDPATFFSEVAALKAQGVSCSNLKVSGMAHVTMPYHLALEACEEERRGKKRIGTTNRGIGPTYADKAMRSGIRVEELLDRDLLKERLSEAVAEKNRILRRLYGRPPLDAHEIMSRYVDFAQDLAPYVSNTSALLYEMHKKRKRILFEGAQGTLLDLDHGSYPYVTSSSATAGGACSGAGIGPSMIDRVIGVTKAFLTRLTDGPLPTEVTGPESEKLRQTGKPWAEVGVHSGLPRRCGWFDAVLGRYAVRINGMDALALTKLDALDELEQVKVCCRYRDRVTGTEFEDLPSCSLLNRMEPIYQTLPGWKTSTANCRTVADLPKNARFYVRWIEQQLGAKVCVIAVGQNREQTIMIENPLTGPCRRLIRARS